LAKENLRRINSPLGDADREFIKSDYPAIATETQ